MDVGKIIQENQALASAVVGFLVSQAVQIWRDWLGEHRAIVGSTLVARCATRSSLVCGEPSSRS